MGPTTLSQLAGQLGGRQNLKEVRFSQTPGGTVFEITATNRDNVTAVNIEDISVKIHPKYKEKIYRADPPSSAL